MITSNLLTKQKYMPVRDNAIVRVPDRTKLNDFDLKSTTHLPKSTVLVVEELDNEKRDNGVDAVTGCWVLRNDVGEVGRRRNDIVSLSSD